MIWFSRYKVISTILMEKEKPLYYCAAFENRNYCALLRLVFVLSRNEYYLDEIILLRFRFLGFFHFLNFCLIFFLVKFLLQSIKK